MFDTQNSKLETGHRRSAVLFFLFFFCSLFTAHCSLLTVHCSLSHAAPMPKETKNSTSAIAGEALALGDVVCIKSADGKAYKASATNATLRPAVGFVSTVARAGSGVRITTSGVFAGYTGLTVGQPVYLSATSGLTTQTATEGWSQQIGVSITAQSIQVEIKAPQAGASYPDQTTASGKFLKSTGVPGSETWDEAASPPGGTTTGAVQYRNSGGALGGDDNCTVDGAGNSSCKSYASRRGAWPQGVTFYEGTNRGNKFRRIVAPAAGYTSGDNETVFELPPGNPPSGYSVLLFPGLGTGQTISQLIWAYGAYLGIETYGTSGLLKTSGTNSLIIATADSDYLTPTGTATLTGKTYDVSGTGNVFKQRRYMTWTHPDRCDEGNATMQTTPATDFYNTCLYKNDEAYTTNYAIYRMPIPPDVDTTVDFKVEEFGIRLGGNDTNAHCYKIDMAVVAPSSPFAPSSFANAVNIPLAADASGASGDFESATNITLTGWAATSGIGTVGNRLVIRVGRDGGNEATGCTAGAGSTVDSYGAGLIISYGTSQ